MIVVMVLAAVLVAAIPGRLPRLLGTLGGAWASVLAVAAAPVTRSCINRRLVMRGAPMAMAARLLSCTLLRPRDAAATASSVLLRTVLPLRLVGLVVNISCPASALTIVMVVASMMLVVPSAVIW